MNTKRLTRLLKLLQMLQAGDGQNADGLASASGVSRRTVFRDIEALKVAGVPVAYDRATDRYSLPGGYFLPPTNFTAEEALAIISLTTQIAHPEKLPFYEPARRAALKIEAGLPDELRNQVRELLHGTTVSSRQINSLEEKDAFYQQLVQAQSQKRQVWIRYDSLTEWEEIETVIRPYQLMFNNRSWYIIGRSSLHKEVRTFNIGRILSLTLLDEFFKPPRGFSLKRYLGNAWRMIPEPGPDHEVLLRFGPAVARNVDEVRWHQTQKTAWRDDGYLDFSATVSGLNEISWWVLQYGDQVEVLKPAKLRRLVAQRIKNMAQLYGP